MINLRSYAQITKEILNLSSKDNFLSPLISTSTGPKDSFGPMTTDRDIGEEVVGWVRVLIASRLSALKNSFMDAELSNHFTGPFEAIFNTIRKLLGYTGSPFEIQIEGCKSSNLNKFVGNLREIFKN